MKGLKVRTALITLVCALILVTLSTAPTQALRQNSVSTGLQPNATPEPPEANWQMRAAPDMAVANAQNGILSVGEIVTSTSPQALAEALDISTAFVSAASFNGSDPLAFGIGKNTLGYHFPTSGNSFVILSTGLAQSAEWPNAQSNLTYILNGLNNSQGNDMAQLSLTLSVPAYANCAGFDFAFYSEEFPEYVGSQFNDTFTAELGESNLIISGTQVVAPRNFAFDVGNRIISINTVSGVGAPTGTTYDGKTPLRRAKTPVTPGQIAKFVFTMQDLGDSWWDSAVLLDNFAFTYDPTCNPGVKPPITAQGNLQLHVPSDIDTGKPIHLAATVLNQNSAPVSYSLVVQLWRGIALYDEKQFSVNLATSGSQLTSMDFGIYPSDKYLIRAELFQGQERLDSQQAFVYVGYANTRLSVAASSLSSSAYKELNESQSMSTESLAWATLDWGEEIFDKGVDALIGKVLTKIHVDELFPGDKVAGDKAASAINKIASLAAKAKEAVKMKTFPLIEAYYRQSSDANAFNNRRDAVEKAGTDLRNYAIQKDFSWDYAWQEDIAHYTTVIENVNETDHSGFGIEPEITSPYFHQATLVEMRGQFDLLRDKWIKSLEAVGTVALLLLFAAIIVAAILAIIGTGGIAAAAVAGAIAVLKPIVAVIANVKVISLIIVFVFAITISMSAEEFISPHIVDVHNNGINWLKDRVDGKPLASEILSLEVKADTRGHQAMAQTSVNTSAGVAIANTQLYRADGRLLDITSNLEISNNQKATHAWSLQPSTYWIVGVAHAQESVVTKRTTFTIPNPQVELSLFLSKGSFALGETVKATVVARNLDATQGTGTFMLNISTLGGESLQFWSTALDAGQTATFEYAGFVPQAEGGYVMRASISNESGIFTRVDRAFAVGSAAAVQLNVSPQTVYPPVGSVVWNITAVNAGNQPTTTLVTLNTRDLNDHYKLINTSSHTLTLSAQATESLSVPVLQSALPGFYSTHLEMNGRVIRSDNYLVSADGTLFAVIQAEPIAATLGQAVAITVAVQNELYSPIDVDVTLTLLTPDGQSLVQSLHQVGTGFYQTNYTPVMSGTFQIKATVNKPNYAGNKATSYFWVDDASLLLTAVEGQLVFNEPSPITLTVQNERGLPVSDATVIISDTQGAAVVMTKVDGKASFTLNSTDIAPRLVILEKAGYANTSMQLMVKDSAGSKSPVLVLAVPDTTNQNSLVVFGKTDAGATVTLQGQAIAVNPKGSFTGTVQLFEGENVVTAGAVNTLGMTTSITKKVILDTTPPALEIQAPDDNAPTTLPLVTYVGKVEPGSVLFMNDQIVTVSNDGSFSATIVLGKYGVNVTTFQAIDAAGNVTQQQRTVMRKSLQNLPITFRQVSFSQ